MLRFTWATPAGPDEITIQQDSAFSTIGYSEITVYFDLLRDLVSTPPSDSVVFKYSLDGLNWVRYHRAIRRDGSEGWKTEVIHLPDSLGNQPTVYVAFRFYAVGGNDMYLDNLIITGRSLMVIDPIPSISLCNGDIECEGNFQAASIDVTSFEASSVIASNVDISNSLTLDGETISNWGNIDVTDINDVLTIRGQGHHAPHTMSGNDEKSLRLTGPTSDYIISIQDGSGRIQHYWNSTTASPHNRLLVDSEPAWMWDIDIQSDPYMEFCYEDPDTAGHIIVWQTHIAVRPNGNVGISSTSPTRRLYVNGSAGGTTEWFNDSDFRLKHSIETIDNALQKVEQLRGVYFEWNEPENHMPGRQMGFIAQEALPVIPEVVDKAGEYYGMAYASINALLVEAIKEQQAQIVELKQRIEELESRSEDK